MTTANMLRTALAFANKTVVLAKTIELGFKDAFTGNKPVWRDSDSTLADHYGSMLWVVHPAHNAIKIAVDFAEKVVIGDDPPMKKLVFNGTVDSALEIITALRAAGIALKSFEFTDYTDNFDDGLISKLTLNYDWHVTSGKEVVIDTSTAKASYTVSRPTS